jgi:hypothetical protein
MFSYLITLALLWLVQAAALHRVYLNPQPLPPGSAAYWLIALLIALCADFYGLYWSKRPRAQQESTQT